MILRDDLGRGVFIARLPARRIVSLSPSATENLFALGAGGQIVGVTTACDYPTPAKKLPRVGDFYRPSVERIRALRPDVVIVDSATVARRDMDNLQARLKVPIFAQKSTRFDDVLTHLDQLGRITGKTAAAAKQIAGMKTKAQKATRIAAQGRRRPTVFVEVSATPLYAAGPGSFVDDLIRRAGGVNIVKGSNPFPVFSKESLLAADPEHYVIALGGDMGRASGGKATLAPPLDRLSAAKRGSVHRLSADLLFRATPRLADGLLALASVLHPTAPPK